MEMEIIEKKNIQIGDNNNKNRSLAAQLPRTANNKNTIFEVNDEKSKNENSVLLKSQALQRRAQFKKSKTCGSFYVDCGCNHNLNNAQKLNTDIDSNKEKRRQRSSQSFSHPDTAQIFTEENKYATDVTGTSPKTSIVTSRSGDFQVLHSRRLSNSDDQLNYAFHPEFVLKKIESNSTASKPPRPILKNNAKSFPGLKTSKSFHFSRSTNDRSLDKSVLAVKSLDRISNFNLVCANSDNNNNNNKDKNSNKENYFDEGHQTNDVEITENLKQVLPSSVLAKFDDSAQEYFMQSGILGPMGNGVSTVLLRKSSRILPVLDRPTKDQIRKNSLIHAKNNEIRRKSIPGDFDHKSPGGIMNNKQKVMEEEISNLKEIIRDQDEEICKLKREIDKLKSVLQQTAKNRCYSNEEGDLLSSLQTNHEMAGQSNFSFQDNLSLHSSHLGSNNSLLGLKGTRGLMLQAIKKQGVSGESCDIMGSTASDISVPKYDKDYSSKILIKNAIMENDFLKNIDTIQIREIIDCMYSLEYHAGEYVIKEGDSGSHLYVSADGQFEVLKDNRILGIMGPGKAFGELAILYNCTRTASIRVLSDSRVWVLDRRAFQKIMMRTGMQRIEENVNFLRSVPLFRDLSNDVLCMVADVLEVEFYPANAYIIRQGAIGDKFYIISQGIVKVTQTIPGSKKEEEIRFLTRGDYFGEQALIKQENRTANILAMSPGVECLTLDRESFNQHISDLCELHEKDYGDEERILTVKDTISRPTSLEESEPEPLDIKIDDLEIVGTLGIGGFGRVELVTSGKGKRQQTYALKCMKKKHIVDTRQEEHVYNERKIMISCHSPFICRLYQTYKDRKYIYLLMEPCMGGEVWTLLRDRVSFDDFVTKFITGCVLEAFEYLHTRGIVYRDLKPENLMLDTKGYVKLVDFGFAKFIGYSNKTWTFCGTPEYVAPEIILNKGHDRTVDYWSLGILIHELLTGIPPFSGNDPMKTYNLILKGIDMVNFPKHMSRSAISIIKQLCRDIPSERLGYQRGGVQDIKKHRFYQDFDWEGLAQEQIKSPIAIKVKNPLDLQNFDSFPCDRELPPDETSGWDIYF